MLVQKIDDNVTDIICHVPPTFRERHSTYFDKRHDLEITCSECGVTKPRDAMWYNGSSWVCFEHHNVCSICGRAHPLENLIATPAPYLLSKVCDTCVSLLNLSRYRKRERHD